MREIVIKSIRFVNFKGLREITIAFPAKHTDIAADNGVGKSSILDGFTWVLFGKDRKDRKQFGIKTLDQNNRVIPRIPHEVEVLLEVIDTENGSTTSQDVKLTRRFNEKWVKQRGSAKEEFQGHEEERLYNDVPCSLKEWNEKIASLCPEQVFKFITNPLYFTSQKADVQREMLFRMVGGVSDAEIAAGNKAFADLLASITGKSMEEYKKEISAKKNRIKADLKNLPGAIEERRRDTTEPEDWSALEKEREKLCSQRDKLLSQLSDRNEAIKANNGKINALNERVYELRKLISSRKFDLEQEATKEYREKLSARAELASQINGLLRSIDSLNIGLKQAGEGVIACEQKRNTLYAKYKELLQESKTITEQMNTVPELSDDDFKCPTCGHTYDYDVIEEIQTKHQEQHRKTGAHLLAKNAAAIEENKKAGRANNDVKKEYEAQVEKISAEIETKQKKVAQLQSLPIYTAEPEKPDTSNIGEGDTMIAGYEGEITTIEAEIKQLATVPDNTIEKELEAKIKEITDEIGTIGVRLSKRAAIERNAARIEELETELRAKNNELAELEGIEFTMAEFSKARIEAVENKINALFSLVRFKMFDTQINGGEVETCEAMIDGVPFSDLNDAGRINAGLDIINAICKFEQVYAPIFIDNSESINRPFATTSQRIRLIVSHDPGFVITSSENTATLFN